MQPNPPPDPRQIQHVLHIVDLQRRMRSGAGNFYWITGLSVVNSLILIFGGGTRFLGALGITRMVDFLAAYLAQQAPGSLAEIKTAGLALSMAIASLFLVFGYHAVRGRRWAFLTGIIIYGLDAILLVFLKDWFDFAFHLLMLWGLYGGLRASTVLSAMIPQTAHDNSFPKDLGD